METNMQNNPYNNNTNPNNHHNNNIYPNNPDSNNVYPNNPYPAQPAAAAVKPEDSIYTKRLKERFPFFGIGSALYALFYTFCLYRNASGITYPFFVIGTLCYFFFSMQKLGVPYKKDSIFYIVSVALLGISNCLTNSGPLLFMNKCAIFMLTFILMIHTVYIDKNWNFPKYLGVLAQLVGTVLICVFRPFSDMTSYFDAQKSEKTDKKSYFLPILIGIAIAIPILLVMTLLLASADVVFSHMLDNMFSTINFSTHFGINFLTIAAFFGSYAVIAALSMKNVKEEVTNHRIFEPVTAIIVTAALSALYLMFSMIQILYLFIGNMHLPDGYTYSGYARQGFFQLLTVCILNLIIVLICLYFFRENMALKIILTVISGCTFIMILSSALRMIMYINCYNLTFLRIFVLWSLAVIFLLMTGVTLFIYMNKFPLFTYSMAIVTMFYIGLSLARPDYWIARYNLDAAHLDYEDDHDRYNGKNYLSSLSTDAAPILLNKEMNPYLQQNMTGDEELSWLHWYCNKVDNLSKNMHIRNFNFSVYTAGKLLSNYNQKNTGELSEFQSTKHDNAIYIVYGEIEYQYYGLPDQADVGERLGILDGNENDGIYSFRDFPTEDFIVEYLYSGLMDSPVLYRATDCTIVPEEVYVFEEAEEAELPDITWLVNDYQVIQDEQKNDIGYFAGGQIYQNYFAVEDGSDRVYIALSNRDTLTLQEIQASMAGESNSADILVVGYYKR